MAKVRQIIKHEYTRHVFTRRFLVSLLSLPLAAIAMVAVTLLIGFVSLDRTPVGFVDYACVVTLAPPPEDSGNIFDPVIALNPYEDENQAKSDLDAEVIQAYYIIPEDYPETLNVELYYLEEPDGSIQSQFSSFMRRNIMASEEIDPAAKERLQEGSLVTMAALDGSREMCEDQWYLILTPFIAGIMFIIVVMTSGDYLLQAVVEEKENRTMEIVITSVTPGQLMTGKIIGNIAVGLTQLVIWLILGWIGLSIGGRFWHVLQDFSLSAGYIVILLLVMLPAFVMVSAIMSAIGSTMVETRETQQVSGLFSLLITIPYYLSSTIMMNPNSNLAIALSCFPLTAPITLLMRMAFTVVPPWQIALNIAILVIFAVLAIWFAGRVFRLGMLRYGKKLSFKELFAYGNEK